MYSSSFTLAPIPEPFTPSHPPLTSHQHLVTWLGFAPFPRVTQSQLCPFRPNSLPTLPSRLLCCLANVDCNDQLMLGQMHLDEDKTPVKFRVAKGNTSSPRWHPVPPCRRGEPQKVMTYNLSMFMSCKGFESSSTLQNEPITYDRNDR